jgi:hypothetical protein
MAVGADVGEGLREEGGVYCGDGVPVLDAGSGGGGCVWDSVSTLAYRMMLRVGCRGRITGRPGSRSHLRG